MIVAKEMYGRRVITTDYNEITENNVIDVLRKSFNTHLLNRSEIDYLWNYYKGKQPILSRIKEYRPEICNRIVENRANEIVSFNVGYLCGEPIQYVGRTGGDIVSQGISQLNEMMFSESKTAKDKEIVEWQMICGTAYRLVLPKTDKTDDDDSPFDILTLDPRDTFIVYSNEIGNKPIMGVKYYTDENGIETFSIYTNNRFWKIRSGKIIDRKQHGLGMIPIFEYQANTALLGAFEIVLPLLDAINTVASNRIDGIEQFVQSFIKFINCDISAEDFKELKELGAIKVKSVEGANADVDIITSELNQMQTQTLVDYLYQTVLTICGIPNRNGGSSTSDTGQAVLLRDGWSLAESRAKDRELMFKKSEKDVLKLILKICRETEGTPSEICSLRLKDIALQFTRRNYDNIQSKAQVLISMLNNNKIHPRLAFAHCGMFSNVEDAFDQSMKYYEEEMKKAEENTVDNEQEKKDIEQ